MLAIVVALILVAILFGAGFAVHVLWWIAIIALVLWLLGFLMRGSGGGGRRWYYW